MLASRVGWNAFETALLCALVTLFLLNVTDYVCLVPEDASFRRLDVMKEGAH